MEADHLRLFKAIDHLAVMIAETTAVTAVFIMATETVHSKYENC